MSLCTMLNSIEVPHKHPSNWAPQLLRPALLTLLCGLQEPKASWDRCVPEPAATSSRRWWSILRYGLPAWAPGNVSTVMFSLHSNVLSPQWCSLSTMMFSLHSNVLSPQFMYTSVCRTIWKDYRFVTDLSNPLRQAMLRNEILKIMNYREEQEYVL